MSFSQVKYPKLSNKILISPKNTFIWVNMINLPIAIEKNKILQIFLQLIGYIIFQLLVIFGLHVKYSDTVSPHNNNNVDASSLC